MLKTLCMFMAVPFCKLMYKDDFKAN